MYRVYLIDDEPWNLVALELLIDWQSLGFQIAGKFDRARVAWEQILRETPDVIVTDIRMPGLSGLELLGRVREAGLPTKVVLVSAYADFSYAQEAIGKGASEYLLKPVRAEDLTACVGRLREELEKSTARRDLEDRQRRRALLTGAASLKEAYAALADETSERPALLYGGEALGRLLDAEADCVRWPRVALEDGELAVLAPQCEGLEDRLSGLCREAGEAGVFGMAEGAAPAAQLLNRARSAWLTARFVGSSGFTAPLDDTAGMAETELSMALLHDQKSRIRAGLDALRGEVESGHLMLDRLFAQLSSLDSFWRSAHGERILPAEWKDADDLLRACPDCGAFFDRLRRTLAADPDEELLRPVLEEVELRYARNRTLADLGQELHVSQAYLSQLIHRRTGKTYSELVQERRMGRAKELLAYSDKAVMDIAIEVGYSDQFYFSKLFRRVEGMSPNAWRKMARSGEQITKR